MKRYLDLAFCLFGTAIVAAVPATARADTTALPRLITVTGEAEVRVAPDEVVLTLGVETLHNQLMVSKTENDERVAKVIAAMKSHDIAEQHIQTDYINIEPLYDWQRAERIFLGYRSRKTIVVILKDIEKFEQILADVLEKGANYVHGIQFRTTELRKHRDHARGLAVQAAREKAVHLAGHLEQTIGRPHSINVGYSRWSPSYGAATWGPRWGGMSQNIVQPLGAVGPDAEAVLAPGKITISANVTVSFELQ